jgi:hypothetical protein
MANEKGQILLYQTPDGESRIEVRLQDETVWLNLDQMAELFQRNKSTISRHIKNVFEEGELQKEMVVANFATTSQHGAIEGKTQTHEVEYYNLDMIISVGGTHKKLLLVRPSHQRTDIKEDKDMNHDLSIRL